MTNLPNKTLASKSIKHHLILFFASLSLLLVLATLNIYPFNVVLNKGIVYAQTILPNITLNPNEQAVLNCPNGKLYIAWVNNRKQVDATCLPISTSTTTSTTFTATLTGATEVPPVSTAATGTAILVLNPDNTAKLTLNFSNLSTAQTAAHIHGPASIGTNAGVLITLPNGTFSSQSVTLNATQITQLKAGQLYINVHTSKNPNGEIRGWLTGGNR